jgi:hypothetical protein
MSRPPERKRRASQLTPDVAGKLENKVTVELETADFDEVGQSGTIPPRPPETALDLPEQQAPSEPPKVMIATEMRLAMIAPPDGVAQTMVELPEQQPGAAVAQREVKTQYVRQINPIRAVMQQPLPERLRGMWLVLLVYVVAIVALVLSIYYRFYT